MRTIVITGPESSGKTILAKALAAHFGVPYVAEYARTYLTALNRPYREGDLELIGKKQMEHEMAVSEDAPLVVCDTGLIVLYVWSMVKYGRVSPWIRQAIASDQTDLYILSKPDMPWEPDPLRENPTDRDVLFEAYLSKLRVHHRPFRTVYGPSRQQRRNMAIRIVKDLFPDIS